LSNILVTNLTGSFFFQAQWGLVMDDLFLENKPLSYFKRPSNLYDFKKTVLSAMKSRYRKITNRGAHSGDAVGRDEDVSAVDSLAVKLCSEMQSAFDKEEARRREAEMWKAQKKAVSNILVPPPPPDVPSHHTQQHATVRDPLSVVTGVANTTNDVPSLEEEMAAIVTPKVAKRQRLTNNDCGDAINKFAEKTAGFYNSFSTYVENKAKADSRSFLLQLLDKLERGVITQQQLDDLKASFL
jgi:hypothetical protein